MPATARRPRPAFHLPLPLPLPGAAATSALRASLSPPSPRVVVRLPRPLGVSLAETRALGGLRRVVVSAVEADSPADGVLRVGDVVLGLPGAPPAASLARLVSAIRAVPDEHVSLVLQRAPPARPARPAPAQPDAPPADPPARARPPGDDIYAHQDHAVAHLTAAYAQRRRGSGKADALAAASALEELLAVAAGIARSRASVSSRSPQLISDLVYRLKRAHVPLNAKFYNILMWSYVSASAPRKAVDLFQEIDSPNVECFTTLAKAYSIMRKPDQAIAIIPKMRRQGVQPNIRTYNALIASCVRGGKLAKARQLFSEMLVDEIRPNAVSWNIIINWHVQQNSGPKRLADALQAFSDMKASGVSPTVVTFTTIMKAYAKSGLLNKAEEVFAEIKQSLPVKVDTNVYNTLLSAYASKLDWRRCLELLDEMDGFYVSDGLSLTGRLGREGENDDVKSVPSHSQSFSTRRPWLSDDEEGESFGSGSSQGIPFSARLPDLDDEHERCKPDEISYSLAVKACASAGRPDIARELFDEMMERGFYPPPSPAVVSLMAGYAKIGNLSESFAILKSLKSWGVFPEERMLSSLMHGCLMADQPSLALSVYAKFKSAKYSADVVTHTLLLKSYGMLGELDKAFNVLKGMKSSDRVAQPNIVTYNTLIEICLRSGRRDFALKALDLLLEDKRAVRAIDRNTFAALSVPVLDDYDSAAEKSSGLGGIGEPALYGTDLKDGKDRPLANIEIDPQRDLEYFVDVLKKIRNGPAYPSGTFYRAFLITCEACEEWDLGARLVKEREMGDFVVGKRDRKMIRALEDAFRARSVSAT